MPSPLTDDARLFLADMQQVWERQEQGFLLDVVRTMHQSPALTLGELEALWDAVQLPRPPALVWQALVQMAALAWRAALALDPAKEP